MPQEIFVVRKLDYIESITTSLEKRGYSYVYNILKQEVMEANKFVSEKLQIPLATKIFSYQKLRIVAGIPQTIENVYIEYQKVPGIEKLDLENRSLYQVLKEQYNYQVKRNEEEVRIVHANQKEAELLRIEEGSEVLMIEGLTYMEPAIPFEYFQLISIPSFFKFRAVNIQ